MCCIPFDDTREELPRASLKKWHTFVVVVVVAVVVQAEAIAAHLLRSGGVVHDGLPRHRPGAS